jgi:hypothetical protein
MAYNQDNLSLLVQGRGTATCIWNYRSADAIATVRAAGYISNAKAMGMRVQDVVLVQDTATPTMQWCVVISVNATTGVADLSDGTAIAQTNT